MKIIFTALILSMNLLAQGQYTIELTHTQEHIGEISGSTSLRLYNGSYRHGEILCADGTLGLVHLRSPIEGKEYDSMVVLGTTNSDCQKLKGDILAKLSRGNIHMVYDHFKILEIENQ